MAKTHPLYAPTLPSLAAIQIYRTAMAACAARATVFMSGLRLPRGDVSGQRLGDETAEALAPLTAAGDFAYTEPDEPADCGRIVALRADGPGSATRVRPVAFESGRNVLRVANPSFPDIAVIRTNETMIRAVVLLVERAVCGARPRHFRCGGQKRPKASCAACRRVRGSGSDGALSRPFAQSRQG